MNDQKVKAYITFKSKKCIEDFEEGKYNYEAPKGQGVQGGGFNDFLIDFDKEFFNYTGKEGGYIYVFDFKDAFYMTEDFINFFLGICGKELNNIVNEYMTYSICRDQNLTKDQTAFIKALDAEIEKYQEFRREFEEEIYA